MNKTTTTTTTTITTITTTATTTTTTIINNKVISKGSQYTSNTINDSIIWSLSVFFTLYYSLYSSVSSVVILPIFLIIFLPILYTDCPTTSYPIYWLSNYFLSTINSFDLLPPILLIPTMRNKFLSSFDFLPILLYFHPHPSSIYPVFSYYHGLVSFRDRNANDTNE